MVAKVTWGSEVFNAVQRSMPLGGNLVVSCGDFWNTNDRYSAYPGYNGYGDTSQQSYHDAFLAAQIEIATGLTAVNADVALKAFRQGVGTYPYGTEFQAGLGRVNPGFTNYSYDGVGWNGLNPRAHDVSIIHFGGFDNHPVTGLYGSMRDQIIDLVVNYNCSFITSMTSHNAGPDAFKVSFGIGAKSPAGAGYYLTVRYNGVRHQFATSPLNVAGIGVIAYTDFNIHIFSGSEGGVLRQYFSTTGTNECPLVMWSPV